MTSADPEAGVSGKAAFFSSLSSLATTSANSEAGVASKGAFFSSLSSLAAKLSGKKPRGYVAPWWEMSASTAALLQKYGFKYDHSQGYRDFQPFYARVGDSWTLIDYSKQAEEWMKPLKHGKEIDLVEIGANWYVDDLPPMMFIKKAPNSHGFVNPRDIEDLWRQQFDWVYREMDYAAFCFTIHPDVSGRPQVIMMLERLIEYVNGHAGVRWATFEEIAEDALTSDPREGRMRLTILGGFLGSGESTWLRHHLHHGFLQDALMVVNEAAIAPVDDALLIGSTRLRVLAGGCACCETRPALVTLLRDICDDRVGGDVSARRIDRIVLETSGLADPGRLVDAIVADPILQHHIVVGEIIVTVDALHGPAQIRDEELGRRQIETADRLVVTKVDAAEPERLRRLVATLRILNRGAAMSGSIMGSPTDLPDASGVDPETLPTAGGSGTPAPIGAAALDLGNTPDWPALTVWLSALIHARGDDIVRIKGIVRTPRGRILLQSVRKVVQSPEILADEPATADSRDGLLVLIGRRFTAGELVRSLKAFGIGGAVAIEARAATAHARRPGPGDG